jgi:hypothetical protein
MKKLFLLAALFLLAPLAARAQVYPAPPNVGLAANRPVNCVASNPGQPLEPQWYFATDTSVLSICIATNTWGTTTGGGGGGGIGGSGTAGFLPEWLNANTLENSLCQDLSSVVLLCGESISVGPNAFQISKTNSASGTTQFLSVAWDSARNAITALPGNSVRGIAGLNAGTSGTLQIAIGGEYPWICDNQTVINDWLVESTTTAGECHDVGASELPGVQNIAQVAGANSGAGTATLADIFTPDTTNAPAGPPTVIQVNGSPLASTTANFNSTSPAAPSNNVNLPFATDGLSPSGISVAAPLATSSQAGIVQLATDLGGSSGAPNVVGIQGIPCTLTGTPVASQVWGFSSPTACTNLSLGVKPRTFSGGTDTILSTDRTGWVIPTTSGTVATTLPQAGTTGFTSNFPFATLNNATGTDTITPTTSTINGGATLAILSKWFAITISDNTNYFAAVMPTFGAFPTCPDSGGNHLNFTTAAGILCGTSGGSSTTWATLAGGTNTSSAFLCGAGCSLAPTSTGIVTANYINPLAAVTGNDCAGFSSSGSTAIPLQDQGPCGGASAGSPFGVHDIGTATAYTIQTGDDKHLVTGEPTAAATYTLPQPSSGTAPFVSSASSSDCTTATTCAVTISLTAANAVRVVGQWSVNSSTLPAFAVSDNKSDSYAITLVPTQVSVSGFWVVTAEALAFNVAGGSTTITMACSNCGSISVSHQAVYALQYTTLTGLDGTFNPSTGTTIPNGTATTNFKNDVLFWAVDTFGCGSTNTEVPSGFTKRIQLNSVIGALNGSISDGIAAFPGVNNPSLATSCAGNGWVVDVGAVRSTTTLSFLNGTSFTVRNGGTANITLTPTSSTIDGQTTLIVPPNGSCTVMSDGSNWQALGCGSAPNLTTNGVMGQKVEVAGVNTSNTGADVGATTLFTTGATDAFYEVNAYAVCRTSVAGTETVTITYTDTNSATQTAAATTGTCNSTPADASITKSFRAKASTNIQYTTTHASSQPSYDVSVAIYQLATK